MRRSCRHAAAAGLAALVCLVAAADPAAAGAERSLWVAPPQADASLRPLAAGFARWLERRIDAAGLVAERAPAAADLGDLLDQAGAAGAAYALVPELREGRGAARVDLRLYAPGSNALVAAARDEAPVASIGEACEGAARQLLAQLGVREEEAKGAAPPLLDELASASRAEAFVARGELLRAWREVEGKLSATAIALRGEILEEARHSDAPAAERARVLAAAGDDATAWSLIAAELPRQLAAAQPDRRVLLAAAEVHIARSRPRAARQLLEPYLEQHPDDAEAQLDLGIALSFQKDPAKTRPPLERAARLAPDDPRPWLHLEALETEPPAVRARAALEAGLREARRWNPQRAQRLLRRAVELDPGLAGESRAGEARMWEQVGQPAEALDAWHGAVGAGVESAEAWSGIGRAQRALGKSEAEGSLRRALALDPNHVEALTELGRLQVGTGRAADAVPLLERAVAAAPAAPEPRRALAAALRASGRSAEALEALRGGDGPRSAADWQEAAAAQRELGQLEPALASLDRAVALEPYAPKLELERAEVLAQLGRADEADGARRLSALLDDTAELAAAGSDAPAEGEPNFDDLALSFATQVAHSHQRRVALLGLREAPGWRELLLAWLHPRVPDTERLQDALERALALRFALVAPRAPDSPIHRAQVDRLYAFEKRDSLDAQVIADVNSRLDTDAVFATRISRDLPVPASPGDVTPECGKRGRIEVEMRMLQGQHPDVVTILADVECLPGGVAAYGSWNRRALALYALAGLVCLFPLLRGWGTVLVEIKLPPRTKGFLRIKIGKKAEAVAKADARKKEGGRLRRSLASFSRFQKHMAGRETTFRWIPARRRAYFVTVRGPLTDAMGGDVIGHFLEEQRLRVERGRVARLVYDFNPSECAVKVSVLRGGAPVPGARVALRSSPDSLRYARDGTAFLYLGVGAHTVVAGAGDRASERNVEIRTLENAVPVDIDLGNEAGLLVRNCAEAVEPYLIGDFASAAAALEAAGETQLAHLMRGAHHQQRGEAELAAAEYEAAGCIEEAAELRASGSDHEASAALFEQAGDFARAAAAHRAAGDVADAARCYEAAYDWDAAIECYEELGAHESVISIHEKLGAYFDAALVARDAGDADRALQNLRSVERRDPSYGEACRLTAEVLAERGDFDLAAAKLSEAIELAGGANAPVDLLERYAAMLARGSEPQKALDAWEAVRRVDPTHGEATEHIAALRARLPSPGAAAGAATGESRYELLEEIGRGGMGVVFKARDKRLGRIVALKRMPENLRDNPTAAQLFLREAQAAASLNHTNIVTVYDAGEENGIYHITMELLEGLPLDQIQRRHGRIAPRDTARLGVQICAGLQYAHERRIVHRDIKTANLFFTRAKVVKIMDFGLAKTIEEVRRSSTVIGGTPYYMAPEQAAGERVDHRTDLYALGVTFFRLLTGSFPFSEGDLAYQHRHSLPPDPRELVPDLPATLAELVLALLAKTPDARPASAAEVGARLQALVNAAS